ncbi:MAG TPA: 2Fe-2S iron-sulfur cluster-binding protein [Desulfosporosinus sp.]|nr:2Fe-2S iron-sulfur cluster-binding protein [Desulfosporosinus sp.]
MDIRLKVFRFDSDLDAEPYYSNYTLPWTDGLTLLMAIKRIYETIDPTLGFRNYFCGRGLCGSCLMTVDGRVKKSCHVILEADREYLVEPLKNYPVIRDLVVQFGDQQPTAENRVIS